MSTVTLTQRAVAKEASAPVALPPKMSRTGKVVNRVPAVKPPFTVGDIRRAIPAHCFQRPLTKSFAYLAWDLVILGLLFWMSTFIDVVAPDSRFGSTFGPLVRHLLWSAYWLASGCVGTGLWVIGHECGHGGFADSPLINDIVGCVVHSFLLVPYFAWAMSHKRHHSNTGSIEHDEVFVARHATPEQHAVQKKRDEAHAARQHFHEDEESAVTALVNVSRRLFFMGVMFTVGWPAYLAANVSGNKSYSPSQWVSTYTHACTSHHCT